jgi:tellurite resistance protein TerC
VEPPLWAWIALIASVPVLATIDLLVFGRGDREVPVRTAAIWSACWIALGLSFAGIMGATEGRTAAGEYLSGYLIEWSLSIDNLFVFAVIFGYFVVPKAVQPRVLLFGVLGALVFRGIFIAIGAVALGAAHWVIYVFGAFLVFTAYRLARSTGEHVDPSRNKLLLLVNRFVPSTSAYHGNQVFITEGGRRLATPVFAVLLVVASTDVVFAIDSIPAIFAVTDEAFIVLAANVFALMGLRAMYFVIVGMLTRFRYLNYGLAVVLGLVGAKMLLSDVYHPPVYITLGAVVVVLGTAVLASLWATRNDEPEDLDIDLDPPPGTEPGTAPGIRSSL